MPSRSEILSMLNVGVEFYNLSNETLVTSCDRRGEGYREIMNVMPEIITLASQRSIPSYPEYPFAYSELLQLKDIHGTEYEERFGFEFKELSEETLSDLAQDADAPGSDWHTIEYLAQNQMLPEVKPEDIFDLHHYTLSYIFGYEMNAFRTKLDSLGIDYEIVNKEFDPVHDSFDIVKFKTQAADDDAVCKAEDEVDDKFGKIFMELDDSGRGIYPEDFFRTVMTIHAFEDACNYPEADRITYTDESGFLHFKDAEDVDFLEFKPYADECSEYLVNSERETATHEAPSPKARSNRMAPGPSAKAPITPESDARAATQAARAQSGAARTAPTRKEVR